jgi:hypothetical protein
MGVLETQTVYDSSLDRYPRLVALLKTKAQTIFDSVARGRTVRDRYAYVVLWSAQEAGGPLVSVLGSDGDTSRGRLSGSSAVLWDSAKGREIAWSDVFEASVWNGPLREEYCDRLFAVRKEQGESVARVAGDCPQLEALSPVLSRTDTGELAIAFYGATYTAASYATGALYEGIAVPLDATLLRGVKPAYREALGAGAVAPVAPAAASPAAAMLRSRLSPIRGVLAGEIQANDDYYFLPEGRLPLETVAKFDRVINQDKPALFMTLWEGKDGNNWGYSLILDGQQHNLEQTGHNADYSVRTYSDGIVTVRIEDGKSVSNNPAFGYSVDTITLTKGDTSETFRAINSGGA